MEEINKILLKRNLELLNKIKIKENKNNLLFIRNFLKMQIKGE